MSGAGCGSGGAKKFRVPQAGPHPAPRLLGTNSPELSQHQLCPRPSAYSKIIYHAITHSLSRHCLMFMR